VPLSPRDRSICFASCNPGIEPILHAEARELGLARLERQVGGVRFEGGLASLWRANLELRTAVRVLWRLARFEAADADALYRGVSAVDWSVFARPESTLLVSAQTSESRLDHSEFVEQRTKDAIADAFRRASGVRPSVDKDDPDLRVHVHLYRDRATVSLDSSGE
jgi:23S rRNA (guanine2445-N2)-methyltransferase / 23S rRNA (guanine2069-N7)-methyltransferase